MTNKFTFDDKGNIAHRLRQLIGSKSVRSAARSWGLPFSTLNNYLTRGTEPPLKIVQQIAESEGVNQYWLATGLGERYAATERTKYTEKEPVIERIFKLVEKYPSRNEAAKAWGINLNTLQNYYKRRHQAPEPRKKLLLKIAEHENISLEWLQHGAIKEQQRTQKRNENEEKLFALLSPLTDAEKQALFKMLSRKGTETILYLLDEDNIELLRLDKATKAQILGKQPQTPLDTGFNKQCAQDSGEDASDDM